MLGGVCPDGGSSSSAPGGGSASVGSDGGMVDTVEGERGTAAGRRAFRGALPGGVGDEDPPIWSCAPSPAHMRRRVWPERPRGRALLSAVETGRPLAPP